MNSRKGYAATATRARGSVGNFTEGVEFEARANPGKSHAAVAALAHCPTKCLRVVRFMRESVTENDRGRP